MNRTDMPKKKKSKNGKCFFAVILVLVVVYFFIGDYVSEYFSQTSNQIESVMFVIEPGETPLGVAQRLESEGFIKSKYTFIAKYRLNRDIYKNVYHGTYYLDRGMCLTDIMNTLLTEPPEGKTFTLTIPEGYSIEMIAQKCESMDICSKEDFIAAACETNYDYEFIKHIPDGNYKYKLEGFLFPSTYEFFEDARPRDIVDKMLATFENEYLKTASSFDNLFENMILASMVEREAVIDSERATIAGVIKNRISTNMLLQIDATVVYAISDGRYDIDKVLNKNLKVDSLYNTYKYAGLTPGPICNPGIKSIMAAINSESHNWLFYHTDEVKKDGSHIFTSSFSQHLSTMN